MNNETLSALLQEPTAETSATPASSVGDYSITITSGLADNYRLTYLPGTLSVTDRDVPEIT